MRKIKKTKKIAWCFLFLAVILLLIIIDYSPYLKKYPSPEVAIQSYEKDTKLTVLNISESDSLACVYYINDGELCNELLKKKENQWSIARNGSILSRKTKVSQTGYVIYINSNQNQYYVIVTKWNSDVNTLPSDSLDSIYEEYYDPEISNLHYWFTVIGERPDEYWINVGGEKVQIFE